jgi:hypothetical protein
VAHPTTAFWHHRTGALAVLSVVHLHRKVVGVQRASTIERLRIFGDAEILSS